MNITGIITEYNPFHNGHLYHLTEAKKNTNCDAVICIMSGNFVQRGGPAIVDKWQRTEMALNNGVDLVIELPTYYAVSSAEFFAKGAVKYLHPFATSLLFIPSVYIYYNESALIHALWYVCISMIGILLGASLRRLIGWSNDRKQD